jgi:hypothetical protein
MIHYPFFPLLQDKWFSKRKTKGRKIYGSLLCKMQRKKRNEGPKGGNNEERQTGNARGVPNL